ncbi:MAG: serine protein kinase RIO [Candidatus Micrarchaeota archaeon]|nr:serine protein kinase RIO [Candidatus Micrarchaeota archaeon]
MARRVSRRKMPSRDDFMMKEQMKIEERIFDNRTMMALRKVFTHNIVSSLEFIIASGKEADVYLADPGSKIEGADAVVLKIFRIETSSFMNRVNYIYGDPRFEKIKINPLNVVKTWCKKEYGNLLLAAASGAHVPKPYYFTVNIIAMEFIGTDGVASPSLKDSDLADPPKILDLIIEDMKKLYDIELVHCDVSEYNILMKGDVPYMIDFGQAVVLRHPNAIEFLRRDVHNILAFFAKRYRIEKDEDKVLSYVMGR